MGVFENMLASVVAPNDVNSVVRACGELGDFALGRSVLGLIVRFLLI